MPATTAIRKRKQSYRNAQIVDVTTIRYTQTSVKDTFSNGAPLTWTIYMLKTGQIKPKELPLIRIGCVDNQWRTIDNRRLYCFKQAGVTKVPAIIMQDTTHEFQYKNQSYNDGTTINLIHDPPPNIDDNQMIMAYDPETSECKRWTIRTVLQQTTQLHLMQNGDLPSSSASASGASAPASGASGASLHSRNSTRSSSRCLVNIDREEGDADAPPPTTVSLPTKEPQGQGVAVAAAAATISNVNIRIAVTKTADDDDDYKGVNNSPAQPLPQPHPQAQLLTPQPQPASLSRAPYVPRTPQPGSLSQYRPKRTTTPNRSDARDPKQFLCKSRSTPFVLSNDSNLAAQRMQQRKPQSITPIPTTTNSKQNAGGGHTLNAPFSALHLRQPHRQLQRHAQLQRPPQQHPQQQQQHHHQHQLAYAHHPSSHLYRAPAQPHHGGTLLHVPLPQNCPQPSTHGRYLTPALATPYCTACSNVTNASHAHSHPDSAASTQNQRAPIRRYHSDSTLFGLKKSAPSTLPLPNFGLCSLRDHGAPDEWSDDLELDSDWDEKLELTLLDSNDSHRNRTGAGAGAAAAAGGNVCLEQQQQQQPPCLNYQMPESQLTEQVRRVLDTLYSQYGSQSQSLSDAFFDGIQLFMRQQNKQ